MNSIHRCKPETTYSYTCITSSILLPFNYYIHFSITNLIFWTTYNIYLMIISVRGGWSMFAKLASLTCIFVHFGLLLLICAHTWYLHCVVRLAMNENAQGVKIKAGFKPTKIFSAFIWRLHDSIWVRYKTQISQTPVFVWRNERYCISYFK